MSPNASLFVCMHINNKSTEFQVMQMLSSESILHVNVKFALYWSNIKQILHSHYSFSLMTTFLLKYYI